MITYDQATATRAWGRYPNGDPVFINAHETFHYTGEGPCKIIVGPRGGRTAKIVVWRRSGRTQTWARTPNKFRIPIKHGLSRSWGITEANAYMFHLEGECPLNDEIVDTGSAC